MGKFVITIRKDGEFQFNLFASNGEVILTSQGYTTRAACENGIDSVKSNAFDDSRYDREISSNEKHYFNLNASNGKVIGTSQMYESRTNMENGIASVKKNAPDAEVELEE